MDADERMISFSVSICVYLRFNFLLAVFLDVFFRDLRDSLAAWRRLALGTEGFLHRLPELLLGQLDAAELVEFLAGGFELVAVGEELGAARVPRQVALELLKLIVAYL